MAHKILGSLATGITGLVRTTGLVGELRIPKLWEIGRAEVLLRYGSKENHSNRRIIVSSRLFLYYQVGGPTIMNFDAGC